jgi:ribosomal-protein-alanine acetyltransferase
MGGSILLRVRSATAADIPAMMSLERPCATAAHWAESQYQQALQSSGRDPTYLALVAEQGGSLPLQGFLIAWRIHPEWELENVVVAAEARRKGLATRLLGEFLSQARQTNGEAVHLEVRESNQAARALYRKCGFEEAGRRKGYYANPTEDAVLYRRSLA